MTLVENMNMSFSGKVYPSLEYENVLLLRGVEALLSLLSSIYFIDMVQIFLQRFGMTFFLSINDICNLSNYYYVGNE